MLLLLNLSWRLLRMKRLLVRRGSALLLLSPLLSLSPLLDLSLARHFELMRRDGRSVTHLMTGRVRAVASVVSARDRCTRLMRAWLLRGLTILVLQQLLLSLSTFDVPILGVHTRLSRTRCCRRAVSMVASLAFMGRWSRAIQRTGLQAGMRRQASRWPSAESSRRATACSWRSERSRPSRRIHASVLLPQPLLLFAHIFTLS